MEFRQSASAEARYGTTSVPINKYVDLFVSFKVSHTIYANDNNIDSTIRLGHVESDSCVLCIKILSIMYANEASSLALILIMLEK